MTIDYKEVYKAARQLGVSKRTVKALTDTQDVSLESQRIMLEGVGGKKYTHVEVIAENGRDYVSWSEHWAVEQDDGRTLKIFKVLPEVATETKE